MIHRKKICLEKTESGKDKKGGKVCACVVVVVVVSSMTDLSFFKTNTNGHKVYEKRFNISNYQWGEKQWGWEYNLGQMRS